MAKAERGAFEVHVDASELGAQCRVGTLYRHDVRTDLPASFEYDADWLKSERAFTLDPRLELWSGEQHPPAKASAFGIFMDSAPDRWGRVLMERREAAAALREGRPVRRLQEVDFLLGVHDLTRVGALRFRSLGQEPFLDDSDNAAPPVTDLKELAYISRRVEEPGVEQLPEYERWLATLIAPGSSLGGARPKANFTDDDKRLWIAKFPAHDDRHDVGGWEFVVHKLAARAGVRVPQSRLERLTDRYGTFCVARFDRLPASRRLFASAMTLSSGKMASLEPATSTLQSSSPTTVHRATSTTISHSSFDASCSTCWSPTATTTCAITASSAKPRVGASPMRST